MPAPLPPLTDKQRERLRLIYPRVHRAYQRARMACPEIDMRVRATGGIELWFDLDTHWTRAAEQFLSDALVAYARGEVEADGISLHLNDYFDAHRIRWQDGTASRFYRQE